MSVNLASFHQNVEHVHVLALTHLRKNAMLKGRINSDSLLLWVGAGSQPSPHTAARSLPNTPQGYREREQGEGE